MFKLTPDIAKAWTLALYPFIVISGVVYMILTHREITTNFIALCTALLTGGSIQALIKKGGTNNADDSDNSPSSTGVRPSSDSKLEKPDRRRPDDPGYGGYYFSLFRNC